MNDLKEYEHYRQIMDTMDCLQWKSRSFIGWAIRWKTGPKFFKLSDFNHTGNVLNFPAIGGKDRRWTGEAIARGLSINYLSKKLASHKGECWWFPLKKEHNQHKNIAARWLMEHIGTRYDYGSLLNNLAGKVSADAANLFCSEVNFLAWHYTAVYTMAENLKHLRYEINSPAKETMFIALGLDEYYSRHPDLRPKAPVPADVIQVLDVYEHDGIRILKSD